MVVVEVVVVGVVVVGVVAVGVVVVGVTVLVVPPPDCDEPPDAYLNSSAVDVLLVPSGVVTVTSTAPEPGGAVAVISVLPTKVKLPAAAVPKSTAVTPLKFSPVIVTCVPPDVGPLSGVTALTSGADR
jgi:hypothetical protein